MHHNEDLTLSGGWRSLLHFSCLGKIKIISVSWSHRKSGPGPVTREGEWDRAVNIYSRDQYFANLRRKLGKNVQKCMWDNAKQGVLVTSNGWRVKISEWKLHAQSINKYWKHDMRPAFININLLEIWDIINGNHLYIYLKPPSSARRSLRLQKLCWAPHHWWCDDLAGPELQPVHWVLCLAPGPGSASASRGKKIRVWQLEVAPSLVSDCITHRLHFTVTRSAGPIINYHDIVKWTTRQRFHLSELHVFNEIKLKASQLFVGCFCWSVCKNEARLFESLVKTLIIISGSTCVKNSLGQTQFVNKR